MTFADYQKLADDAELQAIDSFRNHDQKGFLFFSLVFDEMKKIMEEIKNGSND